MVGCGVNEFLDVGFGLEEVVDATLLWFGSCATDVLDDLRVVSDAVFKVYAIIAVARIRLQVQITKLNGQGLRGLY